MKAKLLQYLFLLFITNISFAQRQITKKISNDYWVDSLKVYQNWAVNNIVEVYNKENKLVKSQSNVIYGNSKQYSPSVYTVTNTYDNKNRLIEQYLKSSYGSIYQINILEKRFFRWEYNEIDSLLQYSNGFFDDSLDVEITVYLDKYEYDLNKRISSKKNYQFIGNKFPRGKLSLYSEVVYKYNNDGQVILEKYLPTSNNNNQYETTYTYDDSKRLIMRETDDKINYSFKLKIEYDEYSNVKKECYFNKNIFREYVLTGCTTNLYDSKKNLNNKQYVSYVDEKINQSYRYEYEYNSTNKLIFERLSYLNLERKVFAPEYEVFYKYDKGGNLIQSFRNNNFNYFSNHTINYKYNTKNELIEQVGEEVSEFIDSLNKKYISKSLTTTTIGYNDLIFEEYFPEIQIFPNPANDQITVLTNTENDCLSLVTLNDLTGKEILKFESIKNSYYQCIWSINLPSFILSGEYIVAMKTGNGKSIGKRLKILK